MSVIEYIAVAVLILIVINALPLFRS